MGNTHDSTPDSGEQDVFHLRDLSNAEFLAQYARGTDPVASAAPVVLPVFDGTSGLQQGIDPISNKSLLQAVEE